MQIRQGIVLGAVVGALAVGVGAVSAFGAVAIPGVDGKIRACVKYEDINKYEQMRWITKTTCPKGEKLITWNAKGEKGDKGDQGEPGEDGASGVSDAQFDAETNNGHGLGASQSTVFTLTVPAGTYAVTATTEILNNYDDPHGVTCSLNNITTTKRHVMVDPEDSDVMTVIGKLTTAADGKINLICNGFVSPAAEADNPAILATRIG